MITCRNETEFKCLSRVEQMHIIKRDGHWLQFFNPTEKELLEIVEHNPNYIRYSSGDIPYTVALAAVKNLPFAIKWIVKPTDELIQLVITQDPRFIAYIENVDFKWQQWIIDLDPIYLRYIKNPDPEIIIYAKLKT
jgi:hypothetical protein